MPDSTKSGRRSASTALTASNTQSVGVPSTAKRRLPTLRTRSGLCSVSEWLAPLCSCSGATTQTSRLRLLATRASSFIPGASMPSSLQTRMRAWARSMRSAIGPQNLQPAEIGPKRGRNNDRSVRLLIILEHCDERAPDGETRAVERVDKPGALPFLGPEARIHSPRLELAAIGTARNFAIGVLPR